MTQWTLRNSRVCIFRARGSGRAFCSVEPANKTSDLSAVVGEALTNPPRRREPMAKNLYAQVTATILAELERGCAPWRRDWRSIAGSGIPYNAVSMRPYRGANTVLLWLRAQQQGWSSLGFLTYKQA